MSSQIKMPDALRLFLKNKKAGEKIDKFTILSTLGDGNTAVTYEVKDNYQRRWALKVVLSDSYEGRAPIKEIVRFAPAEDDRFLILPEEFRNISLDFENKSFDFIWIKSRMVKGETLKKFLESNRTFSSEMEVLRFIECITTGLEELLRCGKGYCHGDLHDRNIMRSVIGEGGAIPEIRYVIIDFSEAYQIEKVGEGISSDIVNIGKHLRRFSDAIYQKDDLSRDDEKILNAIQHIPGLLNGNFAESLCITKPSEIYRRFKDALIAQEKRKTSYTLRTPFDSLSAENIVNDTLLADLCLTGMWWTPELEDNKNVLLIGPRGCGKTMIFRRLRLKTKIGANKFEEIGKDKYIAFYLPCESIFFMRFSDLSEVDAERHKDALVLFFNMAIFSEVVSTLKILPEFLGPISKSIYKSLKEILKDELGDVWGKLHLLDTLTSFDELYDYSQIAMRHIRKSIAFGEEVHAKGSNEFTSRLVDAIKREIPSLSGRYFVFFLDDYTEERVPISLQEALHPTVSQRSAEVCFKISAHMFGSIYCYLRPLPLDEGRNIIVINLGTAYLKIEQRPAERELLLEILNERFRHSIGYAGTIQEWLGPSSYPGGMSISRALHDENTRRQFKYHGCEILKLLCTGDYSEMIRMVGVIFHDAGIKQGSQVQRIDPFIQDKSIRRVSSEYLGRIRHIRPDGQKLFDVVNSFGKLSRNLLYERAQVGQGTKTSGEPRKDPFDLLSIYIDDLTKAMLPARKIWERLQKASIFIDIELAPSRDNPIADRATLRRIYCPAFKTTLTSSEHLVLNKDDFEYFIDSPQEFCANFYTRSPKKRLPLFQQEDDDEKEKEIEIDSEDYEVGRLPEKDNRREFIKDAPTKWAETVKILPDAVRINNVIKRNSNYDLFIGALGFEERTTGGIEMLAKLNVKVKNVVLLEFDRFFKEAEKRRKKYQKCILKINSGNAHRPISAPVLVQDLSFPEKMNSLLMSTNKKKVPRILFDFTSCPALILSQTLRLLTNYPCELTLIYSEAKEYFPTEAESKEVRPRGKKVVPPFEGFTFVASPKILQSDDIGERPILLVLFPTFNTERTEGVLSQIEPSKRIWIFGEPHDLSKNEYRIEMAQKFASPLMHSVDKWDLVRTFDYRKTMLSLGGIYHNYRFSFRTVIMPHGSKMQTLGVNLFALVHETALIFATPKSYNPNRYSEGCLQVWAIELGNTNSLVSQLRVSRVIGN